MVGWWESLSEESFVWLFVVLSRLSHIFLPKYGRVCACHSTDDGPTSMALLNVLRSKGSSIDGDSLTRSRKNEEI